MPNRRTLAALIAGALIAGACGLGNESDNGVTETDTGTTTTTPAKQAPAKASKVGGTLTVTADGSTVAWTLAKVETKTTDQFGSKPDNNGRWVNIQLNVKATDGRDAQVWAGDLAIITTDGTRHEQTLTASFTDRPILTGSNLSAGQKTSGWVTFAVPAADLKGARLEIKQLALMSDNPTGYWDLGLK